MFTPFHSDELDAMFKGDQWTVEERQRIKASRHATNYASMKFNVIRGMGYDAVYIDDFASYFGDQQYWARAMKSAARHQYQHASPEERAVIEARWTAIAGMHKPRYLAGKRAVRIVTRVVASKLSPEPKFETRAGMSMTGRSSFIGPSIQNIMRTDVS